MSPSNPSRKRVLPSWMKKVKSVNSSNAADSSTIGVFLDSNNEKKMLSASGENLTNTEDRIIHKSMFVPRNTVLYVMSELELLETAKLVLEEDEHSLSPLQQPENLEALNDSGDDVEKEQQNGEHQTNLNDMPGILDNTSNGLKNPDKLNHEKANCWDSSRLKLKRTSKRRLYENLDTNDSTDEDAMDVEPSPVVGANQITAQSTSAMFPVSENTNKDLKIHLSNPKMDSMHNNQSPSTIMPTQKKRSKPNLSILDEIFF